MSPEDSLAYGALYDGELMYLDDHLQELFDSLKSRGLFEDTIIIVVADHGEIIGEHGFLGHELNVWEGVLRVPLLVRFPKGLPAGLRVAEPVQTVDIFPTILRLVGIEEGEVATNLQGRILPPLGSAVADRPIFVEYMRPLLTLELMKKFRPEFNGEVYDKIYRVIIKEGMKYVWSSDGGKGLYDLAADPEEKVSITDQSGQAALLDEELHNWHSSFTHYNWEKDAGTFRPPDRQTYEQLKSLGYMQ